ncbi:uncharacterized protein BKA78DRAFT_133768 [Phyllosticta capitalensis]|uniref:uncharacterized protein n=1 Tax=Phyllosticta capitalensis TaxID=121624 RepID=UPI00312F6FDA
MERLAGGKAEISHLSFCTLHFSRVRDTTSRVRPGAQRGPLSVVSSHQVHRQSISSSARAPEAVESLPAMASVTRSMAARTLYRRPIIAARFAASKRQPFPRALLWEAPAPSCQTNFLSSNSLHHGRPPCGSHQHPQKFHPRHQPSRLALPGAPLGLAAAVLWRASQDILHSGFQDGRR